MSGIRFKFEDKFYSAARAAYVKVPSGTLLRVASVADDGAATVQEVANKKVSGIAPSDIVDAAEDALPDTPAPDLAALATEWSSLAKVIKESQRGQKSIEATIAAALLAKRAGQKRSDPVPTFALDGRRYRAQKVKDDLPILVPVVEYATV